MPAAAPIIGITGGALGGISSGMGGKKAGDQLDKQLQIQSQQLQLGKDLVGQGMTAWKPAENYWSTLLSGNRAAVQGALGPISEQMREQSQAGIRQLGSSLPAGGERNLALAEARNKQYGDLARLYAGVQPAAAQALGQLAGLPLGAGVSTMGQGAPQVGAGLWAQQMGQQQAAQGMMGAGNLLYQGINKLGNQGNSGSSGGSSSPKG